jgi:exonuclease III
MSPLNEDSLDHGLLDHGSLDPGPDTRSVDWSDESPEHPVDEDAIIGAMMPLEKPAGTTRFYFVNINGMKFEALGGEFDEMCQQVQDAGIDVMGIAETKLDTTNSHVTQTCRRIGRHYCRHSKLCLSSSQRTYGGTAKPGGTMLWSRGHINGRWQSSTTDDMGRWSHMVFQGAKDTKLSVICVYQVCNTNPTNDLTTTTFSKKTAAVTQQYSMMMERGLPAGRHPRKQFKMDLTAFLQSLREQRHEIILMGDFNEVYGDAPDGIEAVANSVGLVDLLHHQCGTTDFATYIRGKSRIDYALVTPGVALACQAAGYEPYKIRFPSADHRGFFMDFDTEALFGNITPPLATPASRVLNSRNQKNRITYIKSKYAFLKDRRWFERLTELMKDSTFDQDAIEKLDRDWVRASKHGEKQCTKFNPLPYCQQLQQLRAVDW